MQMVEGWATTRILVGRRVAAAFSVGSTLPLTTADNEATLNGLTEGHTGAELKVFVNRIARAG